MVLRQKLTLRFKNIVHISIITYIVGFTRTLLWTASAEIKDSTWRFVSIPIPYSPIDFKVRYNTNIPIPYSPIDFKVRNNTNIPIPYSTIDFKVGCNTNTH
jgi:hypothetical protein